MEGGAAIAPSSLGGAKGQAPIAAPPPDGYLPVDPPTGRQRTTASGSRSHDVLQPTTNRDGLTTHDSPAQGDPLWHGVFENSTVGIGITSADGRVIAANIPLQRMLGYDETELRAMTVLEFTHPADIAHTITAFESLATGERTEYRLRKRCLRKDGRIIWTETSLSFVPRAPGQPMLLTGVVTDITEQTETEDALHLLVEVTAAASTAPDTPSMLTACLRGVCKVRGWELGMAWSPGADGMVLVRTSEPYAESPDTRAFIAASQPLTFARGVGLPGRVWASGTAHWVVDVGVDLNFPRNEAARAAGLKGAFAFPVVLGGEVLAVLEFFSRNAREPDAACLDAVEKLGRHLGEVLARHRQAEALHETQAALARISRLSAMGELTASIAHEVNQPLAAVVANASASRRWLAADPPNLAEARATLQHIIDNGNRASEVIRRVRRLLQPGESGHQPLDLNDVVHESLQFLQGAVDRHRITVRAELAERLPSVQGDRVELQQVLMNLMMNGIEAMTGRLGRPRVLTVRSAAHAAPPGVSVTVRDSGVGLDVSLRPQLFDVFFTTKPDGLGLGLPISKSIVEAHHGRLTLVDEPGPGLAFEMWIPAPDTA